MKIKTTFQQRNKFMYMYMYMHTLKDMCRIVSELTITALSVQALSSLSLLDPRPLC